MTGVQTCALPILSSVLSKQTNPNQSDLQSSLHTKTGIDEALVARQTDPVVGVNHPTTSASTKTAINEGLTNRQSTPVIAGTESKVIEVKGTHLSSEEYKALGTTKQLSPRVMRRMTRIYEQNINKMFPDQRSLAAWNTIKNSTGDYSAEKLVNWNQPTNNTYKTLIQEMKKLHKITGLNPWGKTILHPAETPEE